MCPRLFSHLLLLFATSVAYAAVPPKTLSHTTHDLSLVNVTSASNNLSAPSSDASDDPGEDWSWYCTRTPRWSSPGFNPDDCFGMLDYFYLETMHDGGRKLMQFRMVGSKASTYVESQWTPVKYTFGTCTLAFVMVKDFPGPATLPGGYKTGPDSDFSTYYTLWTIAEALVHQCVQRLGEMGWQTAGLEHGIGVFVWATDSDEDMAIEADWPRLTFPVGDALRNGSVASVW